MNAAPLLTLAGVAKSYPAPDGGTLSVLRDIDLAVAPGETLAVLGPSGSGKSTLLHLIGALDRPDTGTITLEGRELGALDDSALARLRNRSIGFVFQAHYLLPHCTVLENVLVPTLAFPSSTQSRAEARERAVSLLRRVGLEARLAHLPGSLSGGERQRAAVVRALINRPRLLLADEPTGALDQATADDLAELLLELNREQGTALIVVTHAARLADRMQRALMLVAGRLLP